MSGPPSVRRLLVQVVIVAALMVGLARWAGRGAGTGGREGPPPDSPEGIGDAGPGSMSVPGDLTFYKTLGSARPAPPPSGGLPSAGLNHDDAGRLSAAQPPGGRGAYVVQALATRDPGAARRLRARLASRGFPAIVQEDRSGPAVIFRVRAARYRTRAEAEAAVQALRRDHLSAWILQEGE
ncbi:MAG: SPOR domain-containing protein [Acidobacteria bacterium]|nr:SPOR domain-containing protein [Acidobacteriota bacterium]